MTPATDKIRELETGIDLETETTQNRFSGSATPISYFLQIYDNKKTRENYRFAIVAFIKCIYSGIYKRPHEMDPYAVSYLK